ncbi:unnamed protein product [Paramecium sonneborni]|uniref:Wntless-like transmembrane domain-containing protein n=1 Tax=Paramecium sonneborni TaxID=65129 RepID=A0A8S1PBI4_9CILI|nr:unnamed protein product [Paramecium sonneborni]
MILSDSQIPLQIDVQSHSRTCLKLTFWLILYITLKVITSRQNQYSFYHFYQQNCKDIDFQNQTIQSCDSDGFFNPQTNYVFLEVAFSIQLQDLFELKKTVLSPKILIHNIKTHLLLYGNQSLSNQTSINPTSQFEKLIINETFNLKIQCNLMVTHYNCLGELKEVNLNNYQFIFSQITVQKPPQYQSLKILNISATLENIKYYRFIFLHQIIFILITLYALFNYLYQIRQYNRFKWPEILKWIPYLLLMMIFYNFPIQIFRLSYYHLVEGYTHIIQFIVQTTLCYFWLLIFEFQQLQNVKDEEFAAIQNKLKQNHLIKFLIVLFYTVPQTVLNLYIIFEKQTRIQFDLKNQMTYSSSQYFISLLAISIYTVNYLYLLYKQWNQKQSDIEQDPSVEKSYEIFDEQDQLRGARSFFKNYKFLHILSTICFAFVLYNEYIRLYEHQKFTTQNALNEQNAFNIYICLVLQLYVPAKLQKYQQPNEQAQDNRIQQNEQNEAI